MRVCKIFFITAGLATYALRSQASETSKEITIALKVSGFTETPGLTIDRTAEFVENDGYQTITIRGRFTEKDSSIAFNKQVVKPDKRGRFQVRVPISSDENQIQIQEVDFLGNAKPVATKIAFSLPSFNSKRVAKSNQSQGPAQNKSAVVDRAPAEIFPQFPRSPLLPKDRFEVSFGFSLLDLTEQGALSYSEKTLSLKLSYDHSFLQNDGSNSGFFGLGASADMTLLPFDVTGASLSLRLFDTETYASYTIPNDSSSWTVGFRGGAYYATTFVSGNVFGFSNVFGPELYPVFSYRLSQSHRIFAEFKYAPVISQARGLDFSDTSLKAGLGYSSERLIFSGDFQSFKINDSGPGYVQLNTVTLSIGLHF